MKAENMERAFFVKPNIATRLIFNTVYILMIPVMVVGTVVEELIKLKKMRILTQAE